jgi:hypothetical protein
VICYFYSCADFHCLGLFSPLSHGKRQTSLYSSPFHLHSRIQQTFHNVGQSITKTDPQRSTTSLSQVPQAEKGTGLASLKQHGGAIQERQSSDRHNFVRPQSIGFFSEIVVGFVYILKVRCRYCNQKSQADSCTREDLCLLRFAYSIGFLFLGAMVLL